MAEKKTSTKKKTGAASGAKSGFRYRFNVTVDRIGGEYSITPVTIAEWKSEPAERVAELK